MSLLFFLFLFLLISGGSFSQIARDHYLIEFTDKNRSPYSIDHPELYLSPKAVSRREKYNLPVTQQDFPVNPWYR